jgi:hypothetical protein
MKIAAIICLFATSVFAQLNSQSIPTDSPPTLVERPSLKSFFDREGVSGTFVLLDVQSNQLTVYDRARRAPDAPGLHIQDR